MFYSMFIN